MKLAALIDDNVQLLQQGVAVIGSIPSQLYAAKEPRTHSAAIGEHVRHCIDFHDCFLAGVHGGEIDYDARQRDERIAQDAAHASATLDALIERWQQFEPAAISSAVRVRMDAPPALQHAWVASTLERELQFLASHTVHHYALVAFRLRLESLPVPHGFGVSTSTTRYEESLASRLR